MSVKTPDNRNFLSPSRFDFALSRLENVEYFVQSANIPGISSPTVEQNNPLNVVKYQPDHMEYGEFNITFIIDEDLKCWTEIYNWMSGINFPITTDQYRDLKAGVNNPFPQTYNKDTGDIYSDATLIIYTDKSNSNIEVQFKDMYPITLTEISMTVSVNDIEYLTANATFVYQHFTINTI